MYLPTRCTLWSLISMFSACLSSRNQGGEEVKQFYMGYIPHVAISDARGEPLYNQSGEVDSRQIEDIFNRSLGH